MNWKTKWIGIGLAALSLGSPITAEGAQYPRDGRRFLRNHPGIRRLVAGHPRLARKIANRVQAREGIVHLLDSLQATEAQREVALESARAAQPIARQARSEAARIRVEVLGAHGGDRAAAREELRERIQELRASTLAALEPHAQRILSTLTHEQREKLDLAATKRGRTLEEARLIQITSFLLTRPRTVPALEAKLAR